MISQQAGLSRATLEISSMISHEFPLIWLDPLSSSLKFEKDLIVFAEIFYLKVFEVVFIKSNL